MNTNDADLLHLFESLTTEQKIDIARRLLQNKEIKSTTVISSEEDKAISFSQPYVFAFTSNFRVFSDLDISKNEFRVLTYILEYMEFGNLINLSQSSLCKALNIASGNMSNIFKKLRQKGILVEHHGHLYINSNIFAKGMSHQLDQKRKEQLSNARNLCAEIEQYPENYTKHSQEERRKLTLETEVKEIYTDAFIFSKKKRITLFLIPITAYILINHEKYIKEQRKMRKQEETLLTQTLICRKYPDKITTTRK